ncbi:MAG TPA: hypothetical protein VMG12_15205 [Polyangiaceae bacterium]|nr:hypothetical protein [Polyangiaceae bacterium]
MSSTRGWTWAVAAALSVGAIGLAPSVVRYWSAQLGADRGGRQTTARALKPLPMDSEMLDAPEPPPSSAPPAQRLGDERSDRARQPRVERVPAPRAPEPSDSREPDAGGDPADEPALTLDDTAPAIVAPGSALPAGHPVVSGSERSPAHDLAPALETEDEGAAPPEEAADPPPIRHVSISVLEARTQPGLCKNSNEGTRAREALIRHFQPLSWDGTSLIYLDPRLPRGTDASLVADLERAESELRRVLLLTPPRPDVFAYYDTQLLLAGGCTNENVVAYYDGALHVVPTQDDVGQSILHEYTHHALTSAGLIGPAWAQEGIAMHMADETWWREGWMSRLLERPFSLEVMESAVPYTLRSDQAALFYAQSAAMVACAIQGDPRGLRGLVESLAAGSERGELSYQLPAAAAPLAWRRCFSDLAR